MRLTLQMPDPVIVRFNDQESPVLPIADLANADCEATRVLAKLMAPQPIRSSARTCPTVIVARSCRVGSPLADWRCRCASPQPRNSGACGWLGCGSRL